jgi:hypothetical protein
VEVKTYSQYHACPNGWYKTDSPKSPLPWLPAEFICAGQAMKLGYRPARRNDQGPFIPVISSTVKGFRGTSSRAYVSRWSKEVK